MDFKQFRANKESHQRITSRQDFTKLIQKKDHMITWNKLIGIFLTLLPQWKLGNKFFETQSHYVKSVRIRSFSGPHFPAFTLNAGKYGPEKHRIPILFMQCRVKINLILTYFMPLLFFYTTKCQWRRSGVFTVNFEQVIAGWVNFWKTHTAWKVSKYGVFSGPYFPRLSPNAG